jgi:uncharacterized protein YndB with AHSA1/START domain
MSQPIRTKQGFTIVRHLDAPRSIVFQAWTDPDHLSWFFETEAAAHTDTRPATVDLRVGGTWEVDMIEGNGRRYTTGGIYLEITPPQKLVFRWGATGGWPPIDPGQPDDGPIVTLTLEDIGSSTEMTLDVEFPEHFSDQAIDEWLSAGVVDGWSETLNRLNPYLSAITS